MTRSNFREELLIGSSGTIDASVGVAPDPKGIVVMFHGLSQTAVEAKQDSPWSEWYAGLRKQGYHVVNAENSYAGAASYLTTSFDGDATGAAYLTEFLAEWEVEVAAAKALVGSDVPVIVVGWSWGGLHALHAAASGTTKTDAWAVHVPATDPNYLTEFTSYSLSTLENFDETELALQQGLMSYAEDDTRVGYLASEQMVIDTGCDSIVYTSLGHTTSTVTINAMLPWSRHLVFP